MARLGVPGRLAALGFRVVRIALNHQEAMNPGL